MAENWQDKYIDKSDINYGAADYETYRSSFIALLQKLYPENFNDYIDNSEVIMLLSSLAYLGENLNYVIEMDTIDNFPATTERLESLLNFARMINYPVRRNHAANGLVKIVQIETDEELYDSLGNSLKNKPIKWNDISNIYWYEQMMLVLNSAFISSNYFGIPVDSKVIENETYNLYSINTVLGKGISYPYTTLVNGMQMNFEIVNPIIENNKLVEHYPDPSNYFNIIYKNDGSGYDSDKNGFFMWFKQGNLNKQDENVSDKQTFYSINVDSTDINDDDIWLEELNLDGSIKTIWTPVASIHSPSYSNIDPDNKKVYQTITNTGDSVTIKFGDGLTADIPYGLFRIYYRTSNGLIYSINPKEMTNIKIIIPYQDSSYRSDQTFNLSVTFSLKEQVNNSKSSLTISDIQDNLPQVTSTQNRMVTEADYNYFPLSYSNTIKKIIAENRVYSGVIDKMIDDNQSNLIQNVNIIVDDGFLYKKVSDESTSIPLPTLMSAESIIYTYIVPIMSLNHFEDFWYDAYGEKGTIIYDNDEHYIDITNYQGSYSAGSLNEAITDSKFTKNSMVKLVRGSTEKWVNIIEINEDKTEVVLSEKLEKNTRWYIKKVYEPFNRVLDDFTFDSIVNTMNQISTLNIMGTSTTKFGLSYNYNNQTWRFIDGQNISDGEYNIETYGTNSDRSWLIWVEWTPTAWYIKWRTIEYIFGSIDTVKFPKIMNENIVDYRSNVISHDFVKVLKINDNINDDIKLLMDSNKLNDDGSLDDSIIGLELQRDLNTNKITNPDSINDIIGKVEVEPDVYEVPKIFFKREESSLGYYVWKLTNDIVEVSSLDEVYSKGPGVYYVNGNDYVGFIYQDINNNLQEVNEEYKVYYGRTGLIAQYKHFTTDYIKIDPVPSAFIEMYVLTSKNYKEVMDWKSNPNRTIATFPEYPTEYELMKEFEILEDNKMLTDEMIWRPLKFKLLFGKEADEKLRAEIKVTKKSTSLVADNIIRQRVLLHMENFFDNSKWLNIKEFNYTELASYIYQNMSNDITNCVIVPLYSDYKFGKLHQIRFNEYEIPLNVATLDNIKVIPYISDDNIRIGK